MTPIFIIRATHWSVPSEKTLAAIDPRHADTFALGFVRMLADELFGSTAWPREAMQIANGGDWAKLLLHIQLHRISLMEGADGGEERWARELCGLAPRDATSRLASVAEFEVWIEEHQLPSSRREAFFEMQTPGRDDLPMLAGAEFPASITIDGVVVPVEPARGTEDLIPCARLTVDATELTTLGSALSRHISYISGITGEGAPDVPAAEALLEKLDALYRETFA